MNLLKKSQVLQLSTGHEGGAGLAARRLNASLRAVGIDSTFCAIERSGFHPGVFEQALHRTPTKALTGKINAILQTRLSQESFFSLASTSLIDEKWLKEHHINRGTVLHFHNWFNLVSVKQIGRIQSLGYRIFVTMHDERIFTGGCHYSLSCNNFTSGCRKCPSIPRIVQGFPRVNLLSTARHLRNETNPITLIAPSQWIADEFSKSAIAGVFNVEVIPNVHGELNFAQVKDTNPVVVRIGYASKYSNSWIKGFDLLEALIEESKQSDVNFEFIYMSDFEDSESINSSFWREIDFLIVPSRMDNSPNVIHEAKINGVPVIASAVGGITELLSSETDISFDIDAFHPGDLLTRIAKYAQLEKNKTNNTIYQNLYKNEQLSALDKLIRLYGFRV